MQLLIEETGVAFIFGSDNFSREVRTMCEKLLYDVSGFVLRTFIYEDVLALKVFRKSL